MKVVAFLLRSISLSLWLYILHSVLKALPMDRLIWFLYWSYVPLGFVLTGIELALQKDAAPKK